MDESALAIQLNRSLNRLDGLYRSRYGEFVHPPGIAKLNPLEQDIMTLFEWQRMIPVKDIVLKLSLPNSTVTSGINRLVDKGLIIKEVMPEDRRAYQLQLTPGGMDIVTYNRYLKQQFAEAVLDGLASESEKADLVALLDKAVQSMEQLTDDPLRSDIMNLLQKEYNGFGPWLLPITDVEDIPQQYIRFKEKILSSDYCFKVPIRQERRKLRPGMLMYTAVIAINQKKILLLKATPDGLVDQEIDFSSIRYLTVTRDLLDSHFIIGTDQKVYDIHYDSISTEISETVIDLLRHRIFTEEAHVDDSVALDKSLVDKFRYGAMFESVLKGEKLNLIGYQPGIGIEKHHDTQFEAFLNSFRKYELQDLAVFAHPRSLILINSIKEIKRLNEHDYSYRYVFMKTADITSVELMDEPAAEHMKSLVFKIGEEVVSFKVTDEFDRRAILKYLKL